MTQGSSTAVMDFETHWLFAFCVVFYGIWEIDLSRWRLSQLQDSEQRGSFISNFDLYKVMIDISLFAALAQ